MQWISRLVEGVRRRLLPGWDDQRHLLGDVRTQVDKLSKRVETAAARSAEREQDVRERLRTMSDRQADDLQRAGRVDRRLGKLERELRSASKTQDRLLKRAGRAWTQVGDQQQLFDRLDRLQASDAPIIVGPWTGEVGFELLYWVPFLNWALASRGIDPARVIAVSRGGAQPWYAHVARRYVDLLDVVSPEQFRAATELSKKQRLVSPFDFDVLRMIRRRLALPRAHLLHPQLMYRMFLPTWRGEPAVSKVEAFTQFRLFDNVAAPSWRSTLPERYAAVKVYFSLSFPPTEENRAFTAQLVRRTAERMPVVVLRSGVKLDDHDDWSAHGGDRVVTVDHLLTPTNNLAVQTQVIAGADVFLGTYGGFSYLSPFVGVPSISFYSRRDTFFPHHLDLAGRVFRQLGVRFLALDTQDFELFERVFGQTPKTSVPC